MFILKTVTLLFLCVYNSIGDAVPSAEVEGYKSNRTDRAVSSIFSPPDRIVHKSGGYFRRDDFSSTNSNAPPKTPRGFSDSVSDDPDFNSQATSDPNRGWLPYYLPPLTDAMYYSPSSQDFNVWKREDNSPVNKKSDYSFPKFNPDYAEMMMMLQAMKKMDANSNSKTSLLTRIIDNPTTLVMATFIPMSLLLAAALPVLINVMMNGITIPSFVSTVTGSKTRRMRGDNSTDLLRPLLESLVDFNSRYLEGSDCLHKVFCEMAKENTTTVSSVPGAKYLRKAANAATIIVNEDLLNSIGVKTLVESIKSGKCDEIVCSKDSEKESPSLINVINDSIYSYSFKSRPKTR